MDENDNFPQSGNVIPFFISISSTVSTIRKQCLESPEALPSYTIENSNSLVHHWDYLQFLG